MVEALCNKEEICRLLIQRGADVNGTIYIMVMAAFHLEGGLGNIRR